VTPGKRKAPESTGADAITKPNQPLKTIAEATDESDDFGFWAKAAMGKTRPAVREPDRSHYECRDCRWSA
jgi:hypothetical protein